MSCFLQVQKFMDERNDNVNELYKVGILEYIVGPIHPGVETPVFSDPSYKTGCCIHTHVGDNPVSNINSDGSNSGRCTATRRLVV